MDFQRFLLKAWKIPKAVQESYGLALIVASGVKSRLHERANQRHCDQEFSNVLPSNQQSSQQEQLTVEQFV